MGEDDFFVEDESIEEVKASIRRGEKGETIGSRTLNEHDQAVVDRAVAWLENPTGDAPLPKTA